MTRHLRTANYRLVCRLPSVVAEKVHYAGPRVDPHTISQSRKPGAWYPCLHDECLCFMRATPVDLALCVFRRAGRYLVSMLSHTSCRGHSHDSPRVLSLSFGNTMFLSPCAPLMTALLSTFGPSPADDRPTRCKLIKRRGREDEDKELSKRRV